MGGARLSNDLCADSRDVLFAIDDETDLTIDDPKHFTIVGMNVRDIDRASMRLDVVVPFEAAPGSFDEGLAVDELGLDGRVGHGRTTSREIRSIGLWFGEDQKVKN
jgi:hypothetical protein